MKINLLFFYFIFIIYKLDLPKEVGGFNMILQVRQLNPIVMKKIILFLFLFLPLLTLSQTDVYTSEWYEKLDSELECFIFPNPTDVEIKVRVYRGKSKSHTLTLYNSIHKKVLSIDFEKEVDIDISWLSTGVYYVEISNDKKNIYDIFMIH